MPNENEHPRYTDPDHPYSGSGLRYQNNYNRNEYHAGDGPFQFPWWAIVIGFVVWWPLGFIFIGLNEWLLRGLDQGKWLGIESSLMHAGFRKVVFAVLIMLVVLFFSKGIMGNRELSWDGIARFFCTLPQRLKAWPAKQRQKRAERKAEREAKKAARAAAAQKKAHGEEAMKAGKPLFTPLPVYDHVVVFEKEGK